LSMKIGNPGDLGRTPQHAKSHRVYTDALLANL